jgi:hypothetical protein
MIAGADLVLLSVQGCQSSAEIQSASASSATWGNAPVVLTVTLKADVPSESAALLTQSATRQSGVAMTRWMPCSELYVAIRSSAAVGPVEQWLQEQPDVVSVADSAASAVAQPGECTKA